MRKRGGKGWKGGERGGKGGGNEGTKNGIGTLHTVFFPNLTFVEILAGAKNRRKIANNYFEAVKLPPDLCTLGTLSAQLERSWKQNA